MPSKSVNGRGGEGGQSVLRGVMGQPFAEQVAFFRQKLGNLVPTRAWDDMVRDAHDHGFMVAGAMQADLLADLAAAVDKAIAEGRGIDAFRRDFRAIVARHGWTGWTGEGSTGGEAWRVKTILRTNAATSYAAGRYAQLTADDFAFWVYRHGGSEHPRKWHLAWDGLVLPPDHPFWVTHYPPSDWGCSCYALGARSAAGARRLGGDPDKKLPPGWDVRDAKGLLPGIGKNWDYAPGASVADSVSALARKIEQWPAMIGAGFGASLSARQRAALADAFGDFVDNVGAGPARGRSMTVGALRPEWVDAAAARGVVPASAEIVVRDEDVVHIFRDGKLHQIDRDWYRQLPVWIGRPKAVLLDRRHAGAPTMLLIFDRVGGDTNKLVIAIDYKVHRRKGRFNVIRTGRVLPVTALEVEAAHPDVDIIDGVL